MFEGIIDSAAGATGISGDRVRAILAALLGYSTTPANGGFSGLLQQFRDAGLNSAVASWISGDAPQAITGEDAERSLGDRALATIADSSHADRGTVAAAIAAFMPAVVNFLTPGGEVPSDAAVSSQVAGFVSDNEHRHDTHHHAAAADVVDDAVNSDSGMLRWIVPLILLGIVLFLGYQFCGKPPVPAEHKEQNFGTERPPTNTHSNVSTDAHANSNANMNANAEASNSASAEAHGAMTEVVLPNGTKLQAYAGGIEDQLVKFIGSDAYKSGTNDTLKEKWFNFDDLNFKYNSTELEDSSKRQLDNIVAILKAYPDMKIKVGAYTDKKGDDAGNLKLSDGRAKSVQAALAKAGVGAQVPEAEGYGEKFATVDENASDDARKVDRKTAIRLIK